MKKTLHILLIILLFAGLTATAQIQRGKKTSQSKPKTEQTTKNQKTKSSKTTKKTSQKGNRSRTESEEVLKELVELNLTDPTDAWRFKSNNYLNILIHFPQNMISITPDQRANVERIAAYMKSHPETVCVIEGYAGPIEKEIVAGNRAASVRDMLVNKYAIDVNRIQAVGQGITVKFGETNHENRVAFCKFGTKEQSGRRPSDN